jgi:CAAX protease family protein
MPTPRGRSRLSQIAAAHPLWCFNVLAYGFSWSLFVPMALTGSLSPSVMVAGTFGPTLAAITTHRLGTASYQAFRVATGWLRVIAGATVGCILIVVTYVVIPGLIAADPRELHWGVLGSMGVYNWSTLLGGPLGEEPGWRGYALPRLEESVGPTRGALANAVLVAGWHLPLFLIPGWTSSPLWTYVLMQCGLSFILTFSVNTARFSVIPAIATHGMFNTVSRFLGGLFAGVQPRVQTSFDTLLASSGLGTALVLIFLTKGRLAHARVPASREDHAPRDRDPSTETTA